MKLEPRLYQEKIFSKAAEKNTLVVIPTGLGKTIIALMLAKHRLKSFPDSKILFLAPTKPLCSQHKKTFNEFGMESIVLSGAVKPEERIKEWNINNVIFATPQTILNDLLSRRIILNDFSLLVIDEAHRATGNYAYVFIADQYMRQASNPRILGLSASPGTNEEEIRMICKNIHASNLEVKNEESPDVKEYIKEKEVKKIFVQLPDKMKDIKLLIEKVLRSELRVLKELNLIGSADLTKVSKRNILMLQSGLQARLARGEKTRDLFDCVSALASVIKVMHAHELIQCHGLKALSSYFNKMKDQKKVKATAKLFMNDNFREAVRLTLESSFDHPKYEALKKLVSNELSVNPKARFLVFTQYRDVCENIKNYLKDYSTAVFIGQRGNKGMNQKEQARVINEFSEGKHQVLIATSISEEGIHVPDVDAAIFFEPVPSALRTIQRTGRVGRTMLGRIFVLITKETIDENYYWVSYHKQKRMNKSLKKLEKTDLSQNDLRRFMK